MFHLFLGFQVVSFYSALVSKGYQILQVRMYQSLHKYSTFGSKINEFEQKKSEKNEKIPKV